MAKIITADNFPGQKMFLMWFGSHSTTNTVTLYPSGMASVFPYAYDFIPTTFDGEVSKVTLSNNPYSSYNTGPTGSSATLYVYKNSVLLDSDTQTYTAGTPGQQLFFTFSSATFSAGDNISLRFSANGLWRYVTWGIELSAT